MLVTSLAAVSDTGAFEHLLQLTARTLVVPALAFDSSRHVTEAVDVVSNNVHDISPLLNFCNASKKTANVCSLRVQFKNPSPTLSKNLKQNVFFYLLLNF